jgi:peptidoglycan/xylan/chitin deacetylase (PgdA/CDA1 family)
MSTVRPNVWSLLRHAGVLAAWQGYTRRQIRVLSAHGVMDTDTPASWQPLWPRIGVGQLAETLRLLQRYYRFISLSDAADMLSGRREIEPNAIVLTFDDGYRNNFTHALPVLEQLGVPATFFLATGLVGSTQSYWIDRLDYAIQALRPKDRAIPINGGEVVLRFASRRTLADSYLTLRRALKAHHGKDLDAVVDRLATEFEAEAGRRLADIIADDPWSAVMTWDEARRARARGVEIGSHTVDHLRLPFVGAEVAQQQLTDSRAAIARELGTRTIHLAYPNGDCDETVRQLAQQAGYGCAVTTSRGLNRGGDNLYELKRLPFPMQRNADRLLGAVSALRLARGSAPQTATQPPAHASPRA